jgi:hypothetical protein
MSNVIDFTERLKARAKDVKETEAVFEDYDKKVAMRFSIDVVTAMHEMGYDVADHPKSVLDIMSLIETVRALMFRASGEEYHYQHISEQVFQDEEMDYGEALEEFLDEMYKAEDEETT